MYVKGFMNCPVLKCVGQCSPEKAAILGFKSGTKRWAGGIKEEMERSPPSREVPERQ